MRNLRSIDSRILMLWLVAGLLVFGFCFGNAYVYADEAGDADTSDQAEQQVKKQNCILSGSTCDPYYLGWLDPEWHYTAYTKVTYESLTPDIIKVDKETGKGELLKPGKGAVLVRAEETDEYEAVEMKLEFDVKIVRPYLKKIRKNGATRLNWTYTPGAFKYQLFIKYPGSKKFVLAAERPANVRSVLHKNLAKGKVYQYKLRIIVKKNGKKYYGPFSKVRIRKVR